MIDIEINEKALLYSYRYSLFSLKNNVWQDYRLYVLPYFPSRLRTRVAYLPHYPELKKLIEKWGTAELSEIPEKIKKVFLEKQKELLDKYSKSYERLLKELKTDRAEIEVEVDRFVQVNKLKNYSIVVTPVCSGIMGAFHSTEECIYVCPRFDRDVKQVLRLILNSVVDLNLYERDREGGVDFHAEKGDIIDQFIKESKLESKLEGVIPFTDFIESRDIGRFISDSVEYLDRLGYPIKSMIKTSKEIPSLTETERKVLDLLIQNRNEIVPMDSISKVMWPEETAENYSLYAISKIIQRIRNKIKGSGIKTRLIHTQRGKGYTLYD